MDTTDFLKAVLPSTGVYCTCELTTQYRQHHYLDSVAAVAADAGRFAAAGLNTYFALASFNKHGSREAANAHYMRSLFFDLDIDPEGRGGKYKSKKEAVAALHTFLQTSGLATLGNPWLVDSGGGVHVYWPLSADVAITNWQPVAERLKRTAIAQHLHIDRAVTADAARVLRMPGTLNYKYDPPRPTTIKQTGYTFDLEDIDSLLPTMEMLGALAPLNGRAVAPAAPAINIPGKPPVMTPLPVITTAVGKALAPHIDSSFTQILKRSLAGDGCAQVRWFHEHAAEDGMEPMWRGMLSLAKCTTEGLDAGREISAWHPYAEERLQAKWNALQGPYGCHAIEALNPGGCAGCPHAGKITNPLPLGYAYAPQPLPATATTPALPAPPPGYAFVDGCTCRVVADEGGESVAKPILPYIFFLDGVMQEDSIYRALFCRVSTNTVKRIPVPLEKTYNKDDALKALQGFDIIATTPNRPFLYAYVSACVLEASTGNKALHVPSNYGWQPDDSFAFGDRVISSTREYTFTSDRLKNLIEGMEPQGDMATWQRIMTMMCNKGSYDIVTLALTAFASPLMKWSTNGADAMVLHACGRTSGVGKSLALGLARSVWGGKGLIVVPTTSDTTMLQRAGLLGGLPLLVDEITAKNRLSEMEWTPNFIFNFSQGQHKIKGSNSDNAELRHNMMWNGLALLTSNSPVLEHMLGPRVTSSNGEVQRFLEWRCETPLDFTDIERETVRLLDSNYGHAGPQFFRWIVHNLAKARDVHAQVTHYMRRELNATDTERYWLASSAALVTAATLLGPKYADICKINVERVVQFLTGLIARTRELIADNITDANDLISAFMREHNGKFVLITHTNPVASSLSGSVPYTMPASAKGEVVGRIESGRPGRIATFIEIQALRKFCDKRNWTYAQLKEELSKRAVVAEKMMNLFKDTPLTSPPTRCLELVYADTASAPVNAA